MAYQTKAARLRDNLRIKSELEEILKISPMTEIHQPDVLKEAIVVVRSELERVKAQIKELSDG